MPPKATEDTKRREPTSINVDPELWKQAKIEAIQRGVTVTELFEDALRKEISSSTLRKDMNRVKDMSKVK